MIVTVARKARDIRRAVARRRWLALGVAACAALAGALATGLVRDRYEASARIYVDTQTVLKPLMAGLAYQPDIDQQVRMLARTLVSRENIDRVVALPELGYAFADRRDREATILALMAAIKVAPVSPWLSANIFEITYRGDSASRARQMVEAIVNLFVNAGSNNKQRDSTDAGRFIEEQIIAYESKLVAAEDRLKSFKIHNFGMVGSGTQDYFARAATLTDEVVKLRVDLSAAERSREAFRRELSTEEPLLPSDVVIRASSLAVSELEGRLDAQKKQLDDLLRRYTEAHPDVASSRRVIAELQSELKNARQTESSRLTSSGKAATAATSPVYQKLRIALAEAEAQTAGLRSQLAAKQAQLSQVRAAAGRAPQIETELVQLNRDYDVIRKNYDAMVSRRESALLGMKLDQTTQLADFRIIEPPRAAESAVFPARLHAAALVATLSLLLGIGAAALADLLSPTVGDLASLRDMVKRPVLGVVTALNLPGTERIQRKRMQQFLIAATVLLVAQMAWVAWIAMQSRVG